MGRELNNMIKRRGERRDHILGTLGSERGGSGLSNSQCTRKGFSIFFTFQ